MDKKEPKLDTPGERLKSAFKLLGISREEGANAIGTSLVSMNRYLSNQEPIPEFRMDLLLIKKGVSKNFVFNHSGEPKASWEERLALLEKENARLDEVRHNMLLREIVTDLTYLSEDDLKILQAVITKFRQ
ncbi:hypothetical protein LEP1GSC058_1419 [Leptospira fainei serovar Hurstbridge str. BUT 6]|uniref:DNA-binding helix-turn-helix protein n=1 Tax=Leptospira fainei serovar Hurstbridge str. BUT 6 TaxID=1193011 RepID=S3W803_9LEPT|nr:hypothetical protein [Leptospira fainei]EPG76197.1 hypothetical protein LEP1GSC058_1419 [Leptospira fainei serovar Hurstbridge str. BUT 6]